MSTLMSRAGFRHVGAPGQTKLWAPRYNDFFFMEAINLCSEASDYMHAGFEEAPLGTQQGFFFLHFFGQPV